MIHVKKYSLYLYNTWPSIICQTNKVSQSPSFVCFLSANATVIAWLQFTLNLK